MADQTEEPLPRRFSLKDVSGTTIAVTSLAILGAAAVITTPVWLWYRRKRKRTDALLRRSAAPTATPLEQATAAGEQEPTTASNVPSGDRA